MEALPWKEIVKLALPIIVIVVVQLIKRFKPQIKPFIPILAPLVGIAAAGLSAWIGVEVDLSPILIALTGAGAGVVAVGLHQIPKQIGKWKKPEIPTIEMVGGNVKRGL